METMAAIVPKVPKVLEASARVQGHLAPGRFPKPIDSRGWFYFDAPLRHGDSAARLLLYSGFELADRRKIRGPELPVTIALLLDLPGNYPKRRD